MEEQYFSKSTDPNPMDAWEWLEPDEAWALYTYIRPYGLLVSVNDGTDEYAYLGTTFKSRIINFLKLVLKCRACAVE